VIGRCVGFEITPLPHRRMSVERDRGESKITCGDIEKEIGVIKWALEQQYSTRSKDTLQQLKYELSELIKLYSK